MSERWSLHHGDCLAWLRTLPDESVDAVVTDPPYSSLGTAASTASRTEQSSSELQFYTAWCREQIREWRRILKPGGAFWMTVDWRGALCWDEASAAAGFNRLRVGVWDRGGLGMGHVLRSQYECFATATLPGWVRQRADEGDVWRVPWTAANRTVGHAAEKPVELMTRAVTLLCGRGDVILDPFTGSGTTGVAALLEGRTFLGCERSAEHCEIARRRLSAAEEGRVLKAESLATYTEDPRQLPMFGGSR